MGTTKWSWGHNNWYRWRQMGTGCWRLHTGRIAKKDTEGYRWYWSSEGGMSGESLEMAPEKSDLIFVKGLGDRTRPGFSVINNEYIAFHPHQCLPLYEIEYELE